MFIGSINQHLRDILGEMAKEWQGKEIFVGCSGNLTVERILARSGLQGLHGNDVSLYSCAVGNHLAGRDTEISVIRDDMAWLQDYLGSSLEKIATLLLCSAYFEFLDRDTSYHKRMRDHYEANWPELHKKTLKKIEKALEGITLKEFYPMDVMGYAKTVVPDQRAVFISFPPT